MALYLQRMGLADPTNSLGDHTTAIGGGTENTIAAGARAAVIADGESNNVSGQFAAAGGGFGNFASNSFATVTGGL